eukprot:SAG31_NODE_50_length_30520_cov_89.906712_19_plen_161_part_00
MDCRTFYRNAKVSHAHDFRGRRINPPTYGNVQGLIRVVQEGLDDVEGLANSNNVLEPNTELCDGPVLHPPLPFRVNIPEITNLRGTTVIIRIYVIRGIHLAATDPNNSSDPYVVCEYGGTRLQSAVCDNTLNPYFGKMFEFKVLQMFFQHVAAMNNVIFD